MNEDSCKGCPDRWVRDGKRCHDTCEKHLARTAKREAEKAAIREARKSDIESRDYTFARIAHREHIENRRAKRRKY